MASRLTPKGPLEVALGRRFSELRRAKGVTYAKLAADIDASVYSLQRHASGAMMLRADQIVRAAQVLRVEPGQLLITGGMDG